MTRLIETHTVPGAGSQVAVVATDERSPIHGSNHRYKLSVSGGPTLFINFQEGVVQNDNPNGVSIESLLAVCADRLEGFQTGKFPCTENAEALEHINMAMDALKGRTISRLARNVEGKLEA